MNNRYDIAIIGGGAAGLSGALTLSRAGRAVVVIDPGRPRSASAKRPLHTVVGQDGTSLTELVALGRAEIKGYGGDFLTAEAVRVARRMDGFTVTVSTGTSIRARRLLVTTGAVARLPDIAGLAQRWGRDVLDCPYRHGWEARGKPIAVVATDPLAFGRTLLWRQWTEDLTLLTHTGPDLSQEQREQLAARDIAVVDGKVTAVLTQEDALTGLALADGRTVDCAVVVASGELTARSTILAGLDLHPVPLERDGHSVGERIAADANGVTDAPGVWVAGGVTGPLGQIVDATADGVRAGMSINEDLVTEDTTRAVLGRRLY